MSDARLCAHARERCAEMGISTKVAKRIHRNPTMVLPDFNRHPDREFVWSNVEPQYAIVVEHEDEDCDTIVTVLVYAPEGRFSRERPL